MLRKLIAAVALLYLWGPQSFAASLSLDLGTSDTSFAAGSEINFFLNATTVQSVPGILLLSPWFAHVEFGDGALQVLDSGSAGGLSRSYTFEHTYSTPGDYQITAFVSGNLFVSTPSGLLHPDPFSGQDTLSISVATPIPEPETYAMLLAGLAVLGFSARRRKRMIGAA